MLRLATSIAVTIGVLVIATSAGRADRNTALPVLEPPESGYSAPEDAAVIIGIETYQYIAQVPYAMRDAALFHRFLLDTIGVPPHRISNLHKISADRELMLEAIEKRAEQVGAGGTLWVYFAGHGAPSADGQDVYLLGHDARGRADRFPAEGLSRSEVVEQGQRSNAARVLVVLDACFSGKTRTGSTWSQERMGVVPESWGAVPRVAVWSAVREGQYAHTCEAARHGVFTYFAVGALAGWAGGGDGGVQLSEAEAYVARAVESALGEDQRQVPELVSDADVRD